MSARLTVEERLEVISSKDVRTRANCATRIFPIFSEEVSEIWFSRCRIRSLKLLSTDAIL